jgi:NodT family efflux transporter outer membrane factor (OMF) lipoprotein
MNGATSSAAVTEGGGVVVAGPSLSGGSLPFRELFQAGLDASWELDIFGGTRRNLEAAGADLQAAVEDRRDVLVIMMGDVGTNYINLRGFQKQIQIARENLKAQKHNADIIQKRHDAGFVGGLDVANAKAQVATPKPRYRFSSPQPAAIYNLGVLLGREPAALERDLAKTAPIPPTPPAIPVGLPSELLRRRPDIRRAEAQIHAATARIGVATADLFPRFFLTGSFGVTTSDVTKIGSLANNKFWSFGPSVTWPIFAGGRIYWNIKIQDALQEQALLTYEKTVLTALNDVETALVAYAKQQETHKSLSEAVVNNPLPWTSPRSFTGRQVGFSERPHRPAIALCHRRCPGAEYRRLGYQPDCSLQGAGRGLGKGRGSDGGESQPKETGEELLQGRPYWRLFWFT